MNLANNLSILRIILIPLFLTSLIYTPVHEGFFCSLSALLFVLACVTDAMDGYVARRFSQKTQLGSYIDPIADKLLLVSGFLALSFMGHLPEAMRIPAWVTVSVITRDVVILIGALVIFIMSGRLKAEPLLIGKVTTFVQMLTLFSALVMAPAVLRNALFIATTVFTAVSGVLYVRMGERMIK
ncbi:MAG: CDP-alcohol phosphatidyltransferase family protein [Candidatus Omnitrophica bacterium]|nr:CDP-alcohol phosphatidyltransferase family protein [Candidatus Omnitrophota bacterium]